jgi:hypothetical protein
MAEPVTTAAASGALTLGASAAIIPPLTAFGVSLGLRPDELLAGFLGALAAIALLNSVPTSGDTLIELARTSMRRVVVAVASAVTAAYLVPLAAIVFPAIPQGVELSMCFVIGVGAQRFLRAVIDRGVNKIEQT